MFFYICVTGLLYKSDHIQYTVIAYWLKVIYSHGMYKSWILWCPFSRCLLGCLIVSNWNLSCLFELWVQSMPYGWEKTLSFASILDAQQFSWHSILTPSFLNPEGLLQPGLRFAYWIIVLLDGMESRFKGLFLDTWLEIVRKWLLKCTSCVG